MFIYRKATLKDSPEIEFLMNLSINEIIGKIVDERQLEAAKESMGLDTQLVEDGSYFLVFEKEQLIGAGGYSLRSTYFVEIILLIDQIQCLSQVKTLQKSELCILILIGLEKV